MVEINITYQGGLRTHAVHGPSGATLTTDAPLDNQGQGAAFSPTDLVATALGTCIMTLLGIVGERHGMDLSRATIRVNKFMASAPVRKIERLELVICVPGITEAKDRKRLEQAALGCPVHATLDGCCALDPSFEWPE